MNAGKSILGRVLAGSFIVLGYYLTQKESTFTVIIGYISMVWWSSILLFALYKKLHTKTK